MKLDSVPTKAEGGEGESSRFLPHLERAPFDPANGEKMWTAYYAGHPDQAIALCLSMLDKHPETIEYLYSLAVYLENALRKADTDRAYEQIVRVSADEAYAWMSLGKSHSAAGRTERAEAYFRRAIRCRPVTERSWFGLADAARRLGMDALALEGYARALRHFPAYFQANDGLAVSSIKRGDAAIEVERLKETVVQSAYDLTPIDMLARLLFESGQEEELRDFALGMIDVFAQEPWKAQEVVVRIWYLGAVEIAMEASDLLCSRTDDPSFQIFNAFMLPVIYRSETEIDWWRDRYRKATGALAAREDLDFSGPNKLAPSLAFAPWQLLFCHARNNKQITHCTVEAMTRVTRTVGWVAPHCLVPRTRKKIRVGLICLTIMPLLSGLLKHFDRETFEVFYFKLSVNDFGDMSKWERAADHAVYLPNELSEAAEFVSGFELDFLMFAPYDNFNYALNMARLARVQSVIIEPAWTDATPNLDYYISWRAAEPTAHEDFYNSPCALLDRPPFWLERDHSKPADVERADFELPQDKLWYLCSQTLFKFHPAFDAVLKRLLERDPNAIIVIPRGDMGVAAVLRRRFRETLAPYSDRVHFLGTLPGAWAHRLLQISDAVIDCFPLGGMSSTYVSLFLGVPTVTMPVDIPFGKWMAALYRWCGVEDLIAKDVGEFVELAWRSANDPVWREQMVARIKEARETVIEDHAAVRELESFIMAAVERADRGDGPVDFIGGEFRQGRGPAISPRATEIAVGRAAE